MVGTLVHQLTKGVSPEILKREGLGEYYTDHGMCLETILRNLIIRIKLNFDLIIF